MSKPSFNEFSRKMSINYGLERLNLQIESLNQGQNPSFYELKNLPGMEILEKFIPFDPSNFHFKWAILLFLTNLYNYFTVAYFIGFVGFPSGLWLVFEIAFEIILIFDVLLRIFLRNSSGYKHMWFIYEDLTIINLLSLALSSIPYSLLCLAYSQNLSHWGVAMLRLPKLLRGSQISSFFVNIKIIARNTGWLLVDYFKLFLFVLIITHFSAMFYLLIIRLEEPNKYGKSYKLDWKNLGYDRTDILMDIEFWSLGALESITISSIVPLSLLQKVTCVLYMIIGNTIFGTIFIAVIYKLNQQNIKKLESKRKYEAAKTWVDKRKIPEDLKHRILYFYELAEEKFTEMLQYEVLDDLPISLKTEIAMFIYKDLIKKVKFFEVGEPAFIMAFVRHLRPKLFMSEDFILRKGDYAEEFYLISVGTVNVLAADDSTIICSLEDGGYFGEIGILMNICRTVSVQANIATLIASIHKTHLLNVLSNFPEHLEYLKKVAAQRLETTSSTEIDKDFDLLEEESSFDSIISEESEYEYFSPREHKFKSWIEKFITVPESNSIVGKWQIDPFSYFYYIWASLLALAYIFYLYYIPFTLAFYSEGSSIFLFFDLISYTIFIIDIYISFKSSILTNFGSFLHDPSEIKKNYFNTHFMYDILAIIPSDYFCKLYSLNLLFIVLCKSLRFFKCSRLKEILSQIKTKSGFSVSTLRVSTYIPMIFYISHLTACLFMIVCRLQADYNDQFGSNKPGFLSNFEEKNGKSFFDKSISSQYIDMWYFTSSIYTSNTYNLIIPVSLLEKLFCFFLLLIVRLIAATLLAEAATLKGFQNSINIDQKAKMSIYLEWISQNNLPDSLKARIINHSKLIWYKLKGCEDSEVIKYLPESLKVDINSFLFKNLIQNDFFPKQEEGAIRSIIKKCKICLYCAGEFIIVEGELGMELFFILDGEVEVKSADKFFTVLRKGNIFGEMAILNLSPCQRNASVVAMNDVVLAVLSMEDFQEVSEIFPEFNRLVHMEAAKREQNNRKNAFNSSLMMQTLVKSEKSRNNSNYDVNNTEIRENFKSFIDVAIELTLKVNILTSFIRFYKSRWPLVLHTAISLASVLFVPLFIAFSYISILKIAFEIISFLMFFFFGLYFCYILMSLKSLPEETRIQIFVDTDETEVLLKVIHNFLLSLPLYYILINFFNNETSLLIYALIRISSYYYIIECFIKLKENLEWFYVIKIFEVILHFILTSHVLACFFINIATWDENNWINNTTDPEGKKMSDSDISVYVHSAYWAFTCLSHASLGNVVAHSNSEKVFNSFVCLFGSIFYSILFGNICSLVFGFSSKLRGRLYSSFIFVTDFIKKKRVEGMFLRHISNYHSFLWRANKKMIDRNILDELPVNLSMDIQLYRYKAIVAKSEIFKDSESGVNCELSKSLFRLMDIQFYLPGDYIIRINDKAGDLFVILDGEADIINLEGNMILETLRSGDYFGECSVLFNTSIEPVCVIATCISEIGVISKENFKKLISAYPEWAENLVFLAEKKLTDLLPCENIEDVINYIQMFEDSIDVSNDIGTFSKKAEKLISEKLFTNEKFRNRHEWLWLNFIHTSLIVYSVFAIPIEIALDYPVDTYLLYIELIVVIESILFFLVTVRLTLLIRNKPDHEHKDTLKVFYENYVIQDIIACSPFNILFPLLEVTDPKPLIYILRMVRLIAIIRLPSLAHKFELYFREFSHFIAIFKSIFFLSLLIHWFSCFWYFIVSTQSAEFNWKDLNDLNSNSESSTKWVQSMYFVMNVVTGTGFSDSFPITLTEILLTMIFILIGNILFATAFGLFSTLSYIIKSNVDNLLEKFTFVYKILDKFGLSKSSSPSIISRLEAYYAFNDSIISSFGPLDFKVLNSYLPKNLVEQITCECNKHILRKMKIFENKEFDEIVDKVSLCMVPRVYLPDDYIIYFNDMGEEMYFIVLGNIDILSAGGKLLRCMGKGEYFGELALVFDTRRTTSAVSRSLSLLYLLERKDFYEIIKNYPKALEKIIMESRVRTQKVNLINEKKSFEQENEENIVKKMNFYTNNNPFFPDIPKKKHMTVIGSMEKVKAELVMEQIYNAKEDAKFYKRRNGYACEGKRRYSQESLGKELILSNFSKLKMKWTVEQSGIR